MKFFVTIALLFLLISNSLWAQNFGYLGKKLVVNVGANISAGALSFQYLGVKYSGNLEYALSKNISAGFTYNYEHHFYSDNISDDYFIYSNFNISTHYYGFDVNLYRSNMFSVGKYIGFTFFMLNNVSKDIEDNAVPVSQNVDPYSVPPLHNGKMSASNMGIIYRMGQKRVFYDKLVLGYSVAFGLTYLNPFSVEMSNNNTDLMYLISDYNSKSYICQLELKVGYLLF